MSRKKICIIVLGFTFLYFTAMMIVLGHKSSKLGFLSTIFNGRNVEGTSFLDDNLQIDTFTVGPNTIRLYCKKDDGKVLARFGGEDTVDESGLNDVERYYMEYHDFPIESWMRLGEVMDIRVWWGHEDSHGIGFGDIMTFVVGDNDDIEKINYELEKLKKQYRVDFIYVPCTRKKDGLEGLKL